MFRHVTAKALECPTAVHAVYDTMTTEGRRLCGEGVVAQLNPRCPPAHYFVVVTQTRLLLSPLADPMKQRPMTAYANRKRHVTQHTRLVRDDNEAPPKQHLERPRTAPATVASPRTAQAVDRAVARAVERIADTLPVVEKKKKIEWPVDEVVEIDLSAIVEVTVTPFGVPRRRKNANLRRREPPDSLEMYQFVDPTLAAYSLRVSLSFERHASIEFATFTKPTALPRELVAAHHVALVRSHLHLPVVVPNNTRDLAVVTRRLTKPDPALVIKKMERMLCVDLRPKSKYAMPETPYCVVTVEYLNAITAILDDLESRAFLDVEFKAAFFASEKLLRAILDFLGCLDEALLVTSRRVDDPCLAPYNNLTHLEARALQIAFLERALAATRVFVVALHDIRPFPCKLTTWIPVTSLAPFLAVDRYNYRDEDDYMRLAPDLDKGLDEQEKLELHAKLLKQAERRYAQYLNERAKERALVGLKNRQVFAEDFFTKDGVHKAELLNGVLRPHRDVVNNKTTNQDDDTASQTSSSSSSALFEAAAKLAKKKKKPKNETKDEVSSETAWDRNLDSLEGLPQPGPTSPVSPIESRSVHPPRRLSFFIKDEAAAAAFADVESTTIRVADVVERRDVENSDQELFSKLLDAQLLFLGRVDDRTIADLAQTEKEPQCGVVEWIGSHATEDQAETLLLALFERCAALAMTIKHRSRTQQFPQNNTNNEKGLFEPAMAFLSHSRLLLRIIHGGGRLRAVAKIHCVDVLRDFLAKPAFYTDLATCPATRLASSQLQLATALVIQTRTKI